MKTLLIASERENDRTRALAEQIGGDYAVQFLGSEKAIRKMLAVRTDVEAVVLDAPSYVIKDRVLSVSFGASTVTEPDESITDCIAASDAEMYRSKFEKMQKKQ